MLLSKIFKKREMRVNFAKFSVLLGFIDLVLAPMNAAIGNIFTMKVGLLVSTWVGIALLLTFDGFMEKSI